MAKGKIMQIEPIHAFSDNYIWLLHDQQQAWVVDPGDANPVLKTLNDKQLNLAGILITHHHFDHVGGLDALLAQYPGTIVAGPNNPTIEQITQTMTAGSTITVLGHEFVVSEVPGHTLDHIAYFCDSVANPALFCGDTLFAGGCGRIFEGTPEMMLKSLSALAKLPANTAVYCAHEYTLANLAFAAAVEPNNVALQQRIQHCQSLREQNTPTVPSILEEELATNPFLRSSEAEVIATANSRGESSRNANHVFATIREWKNNF